MKIETRQGPAKIIPKEKKPKCARFKGTHYHDGVWYEIYGEDGKRWLIRLEIAP